MPEISVEGCLKTSNLDKNMSPEKRPFASFGESQLCQELITPGQGNNAEKRGTRKDELRVIRSGANKVLLLHVYAILKPYAYLCVQILTAQLATQSQ